MEERTRLENQLKARLTHPDMATTGVDLLVLEKVDYLIKKEIKIYNGMVDSINLTNKSINELKGKDDDESKRKLEGLQKTLEEKNSELKVYVAKIKGGDIVKKIKESLTLTEVKNPNNAIRDNLQLVGYQGKALDSVSVSTIDSFIQININKRFRYETLRRDYFKKNINYFDKLKSTNEAATPAPAKNTL